MLFKSKYFFFLELIIITILQLILLWLSFGEGISGPFAWLGTWAAVLTVWLLPGFLLWRIIGVPNSSFWFEGVPLSFGLGLAWLVLPASAVFILQSNLDRLIQVMVSLNILLVLGYIFFRLTNRLTWFMNSSEKVSYPLNRWLLGGALITMFILLAIFFNTAGYTLNDDQWHIIANVRYLLDTDTAIIYLGFEP